MAEAVIPASLKIQPPPPELAREPLVAHQRSIGWISDAVAGVAEGKTPTWWWFAFIPSVTMLSMLGVMILYLMSSGVGVWGLGQPVMWGWAIVNFVWWIGIGHAGTLISAILFLLRQRWRTGVNRAAEAMTIFAVMCAGIFPLIHIGRIWFGWWLLPLPNANSIWPQFRSPLIWDVFAVSTYFTVSVLIPLRKIRRLEDVITVRHVELMCKVTLATGSIVGYAYGMEFFIAWYSGNPYEQYAFLNRAFGPYAWAYWIMISCNVLTPQFFWFKRIRTNMLIVFILSIFVNIGMWFERFVIVVTSLHREFLPSNWSYYSPTWVDVCTYLGTFGLFFTFFLLFIRFVPLIAIAEVKAVTPQADPHHPLGGAREGGHH